MVTGLVEWPQLLFMARAFRFREARCPAYALALVFTGEWEPWYQGCVPHELVHGSQRERLSRSVDETFRRGLVDDHPRKVSPCSTEVLGAPFP